jgi:hypothetical protein
MARIAYLSRAAQAEVMGPEPNVERAILLLALADARAPDASPSPNRIAVLAQALRDLVWRQRRVKLRKVHPKRMHALIASMKASSVVDL